MQKSKLNIIEMTNKRFSIKDRIRSFKPAFNGLKILIQEEHNSRIHVFAAVCVIIAGFVLNITAFEWRAVGFAVGLVIIIEIINSAFENIADFISPEDNEVIKKIKDLSAAGVLLSALIATGTGLIVFIPKIIELC